jgi:hypothetical protein
LLGGCFAAGIPILSKIVNHFSGLGMYHPGSEAPESGHSIAVT